MIERVQDEIFECILPQLEAKLNGSKSKFLVGDALTFADIQTFVELDDQVKIANSLEAKNGGGIAKHGQSLYGEFTKISQWMKHVESELDGGRKQNQMGDKSS